MGKVMIRTNGQIKRSPSNPLINWMNQTLEKSQTVRIVDTRDAEGVIIIGLVTRRKEGKLGTKRMEIWKVKSEG